jgi:hypothetical protein
VLPGRMRRLASKRSTPRPTEEAKAEPAAPGNASTDLPDIPPVPELPAVPDLEPGPTPDAEADDDGTLTTEQAYRAAYRFVERYQARSQDPDTARLLQWMAIQANGRPSHPAMWPDWLDSVEETREDPAGLDASD